MKQVTKKVYKNIVIVIFVIIFCVMALSIFSSWLNSYILGVSEDKMQDCAAYNSYSTSQELKSALSIVSTIADGMGIQDDLDNATSLEFLRNASKETEFSKVWMVKPDGSAYAGNGGKANFGDTKYFQKAIQGNSLVMRSSSLDSVNGEFIAVCAPVIQRGKIVGAIIAEYDLFTLSQILELTNSAGNENDYANLIEPNGEYILAGNSELALDKKKDNYLEFLKNVSMTGDKNYQEVYDDFQNGKSGIATYRFKDAERVMYYQPLGINDWYLVQTETMASIETLVAPVRLRVSILTLVFFVLCMIAVAFVVQLIVSIEKKKNMQLQDALNHAQQANGAKTQFLSRMSHEIRTPMNAIVGITAIAQKHTEDSKKMSEYLGKISAASGILLNIINDILDMSAIENEKMKIDYAPFSLSQILFNISDIYYPQCRQKGIRFEMITSDVQEDELLGDALRVNQVLLNLISNAYKFTPEGGIVRIRVNQSEPIDDSIYVHFEVQDTGMGMSEEMQKRLFKPFEQESGKIAQKHGGSGLGLSIAKNLIEMMHGAIKVTSKERAGTSFYVDIPFDVSVETKDTKVKKIDEKKILVIESAETIEEGSGVCAVLNRIGISFDCASEQSDITKVLENAIELYTIYDYCFVDWDMSIVSEGNVLAQIRKSLMNGSMIIIATAYDVTEIEDLAREKGVDAFLPKPLFQSKIFDMLVSTRNTAYTKHTADTQVYDFTGVRILLAEDTDFNRDVAIELLTMVNIEVDCALDGQEAYEKFTASAKGRYQMILMDVQMPRMDGYESTQAIRQSPHPEASAIPIIAMTANAFSEDVAEALASGMNAHIAKPIDTEMLYATIAKYTNPCE